MWLSTLVLAHEGCLVAWLTPVVNSCMWQRVPTHKRESAFALLYLCVATFLTTDFSDWRRVVGQVLSAAAVFVTFQHMSVASRLEEAEAKRHDAHTVECHERLTQYLVLKEVFWVTAFVAIGAWNALAGVPLFLLYPVWRRIYLKARLHR
mgnify:CR=1 FL=1